MIFLPQPSSLSYGEGTFTIHYDSRIFLDSESPAELFSAAQLLQQEIETQTGFRLPPSSAGGITPDLSDCLSGIIP